MMQADERVGLSRRQFVRAGAATAAAGLAWEARAEQPPDEEAKRQNDFPRRALGRTGEKVTMLNLGTARGASPRLLSAVYDAGVRYVDAADCYAGGRSEAAIGDWIASNGRRKEFFIVTKDHPHSPDEWVQMLDRRLAALQTDYIDLFFIHELGGGRGADDSVREWPKMKEWGAAADRMKKSGKIRFAGFSTHTEISLRTALLNNAAAGGWVDALMVACDPSLLRENAEFNKALDACHKAQVGLICMKEMRAVAHMPKLLPEFQEMGLTAHQAVLHAVWTDGRFASICSDMHNLRIVQENTTAARNFRPMDEKRVSAVIDLYHRFGSSYCNGCDGRCRQAGGTQAALGDIVRFLSYYETDGSRDLARRLFAALSPQERDWRDADLAAASAACASKLDFAALLARAHEKLA